MVPLYGEYFGLTSQPFSVSPDPRFLYPSPSHREGLAQLTYGIKARRGFVVLTGEVGTGKTTLIHSLLHQLHDDHTHFAFIFMLVTSLKELLRAVCEDLGLIQLGDAQRELHDYLAQLNQFLLESYRKGDNVALVIDEAQNLSPEVLEGVRLLSNFETSEDKVLQIVLVGQPELSVRLNRPELRQLKQRIALRYHLNPLNLSEVKEYIAKRLEIAGGDASIFPAKTVEAVHAYSGGIPRLVNILCDNGMLTAYALGKRSVDVGMIEETARDLNLTVSSSRRAPVETEVTPIKFWESAPAAAVERSWRAAGVAPAKTPTPAAEAARVSVKPEPAFKAEEQPVAVPRREPPPAAAEAEPPSVKAEAVFRPEEQPIAPPRPKPPPIAADIESPSAEPERFFEPEAQPEPEPKSEPTPAAVEAQPPVVKPEPVFKTEAQPTQAPQPEPPPVTVDIELPPAKPEPVSKPEAQPSSTPPPVPPPAAAYVEPPSTKPAPIFKPAEALREPTFVRPAPVFKPPVVEEPKKTPVAHPGPPPSFAARKVESKIEIVPPKSFSFMISALTEAMGPMALLVVREQVDAMGESLQAFPMQKLRRLVEVASREILSDTLRRDFMSVMSEEIRAIYQGNQER